MSNIPESLKAHYEDLGKMKSMLETMKKQQQLRGVENLQKRMAERASTHNTWRQMRGVKLMMNELSHPAVQPFAIGLGVTSAAMLYIYAGALSSDAAKAESKYWQRFHAKQDHH